MRRIICLLTVMLLCAAAVLPGAAFADGFVPSVSYKDGPIIVEGILSEENVEDCLVVTSILAAENKTTDIPQEDRDLLLDIYAKLSDGSMKLPLEGDYVIRELVDIGFKQSACIDPSHVHADELAKPEVNITVTLDLGIGKDVDVQVLHYHDGAWQSVKSVVNNGDGTLTCVFEHFCPVAFCVEESVVDNGPAQTGDVAGRQLSLWMSVMVLSAAAAAALVVGRRKFAA